MPDVKYLFVHTAAADIRNVDAEKIDEWHRARGWSGIGYHYVILDDRHDSKADGTVEKGRDEARNGAHVLGMNRLSLGICCAGHGNVRDFTDKQKQALVQLLVQLANKYDVATENILGHREVNILVDREILGEEFRTSKSCPGSKVDTDEIRGLVEVARAGADIAPAGMLTASAGAGLAEAIRLIEGHQSLLGNARDEWRSFFNNGEIRALLENA